MKISFEKYLVLIGTRLPDFDYTVDELLNNIEYFKTCYENEPSTYDALKHLYLHL